MMTKKKQPVSRANLSTSNPPRRGGAHPAPEDRVKATAKKQKTKATSSTPIQLAKCTLPDRVHFERPKVKGHIDEATTGIMGQRGLDFGDPATYRIRTVVESRGWERLAQYNKVCAPELVCEFYTNLRWRLQCLRRQGIEDLSVITEVQVRGVMVPFSPAVIRKFFRFFPCLEDNLDDPLEDPEEDSL